MIYEYAIIVTDRTRLDFLVDRFNTISQAKFYIEGQGGDFEDYLLEDKIYKTTVETLQVRLSKLIKNKIIDRSFLSSYIFAPTNLIIVVGRDGLVANTAKYSKGLPIIAVNPDKERYNGVLLPFDIDDFHEGVKNVLSKLDNSISVYFAEAELNDGQKMLAFNDLFIGTSTHVSARYRISFGGNFEEHSSSGVIVSTKAGCTGWMSSIFNMAYGVTAMLETSRTPKQPNIRNKELIFAVREPYKSVRTGTEINIGLVTKKRELIIESLMPRNGVIFSDGIESDYLNFNSGSTAHIRLSDIRSELVQNY